VPTGVIVRHSDFVIRHFPPPLDAASLVVRLWPRLARDPVGAVANGLFAAVAQTPAVQSLQRRLEKGGVVKGSPIKAARQAAKRHRPQLFSH